MTGGKSIVLAKKIFLLYAARDTNHCLNKTETLCGNQTKPFKRSALSKWECCHLSHNIITEVRIPFILQQIVYLTYNFQSL